MGCAKCGKQIVFVTITHCAKCNEPGCAACLRYQNGQWLCEKCKARTNKSERKVVK